MGIFDFRLREIFNQVSDRNLVRDASDISMVKPLECLYISHLFEVINSKCLVESIKNFARRAEKAISKQKREKYDQRCSYFTSA